MEPRDPAAAAPEGAAPDTAELEDCRRHRKNLQELVRSLTAERNELRERADRQAETIMDQLQREIERNGQVAEQRRLLTEAADALESGPIDGHEDEGDDGPVWVKGPRELKAEALAARLRRAGASDTDRTEGE